MMGAKQEWTLPLPATHNWAMFAVTALPLMKLQPALQPSLPEDEFALSGVEMLLPRV